MLKNSMNLISARRDLYQAKLLFYLFIASLSVFFLAGLATYLAVRYQAFRPLPDSEPGGIVYQTLRLPVLFWVSTLVLVLVGFFLQRACWLIHRERRAEFQKYLKWSAIAAVGFVLIQSVGMVQLLLQHFSQSDGSTKVYGMSFTLAFIHALHVLGGIGFLGFIIYQANRGRYDHERHWAVDHCAGYWHFLDVVWIGMLLTFVLTR